MPQPSEPASTAAPRTPEVIAGLLLTGGRGSRFSASGGGDKLLAHWRGAALAAQAALLLKHGCAPCFAILPPDKPELQEILQGEGFRTVVSDKVLNGLGASIAEGIRTLREQATPDAVVIMLGDMPAVQTDTLDRLLSAWRGRSPDHHAAAPFHQGRRGHPVVLGSALFAELEQLRGDRGAGALLDGPGLLRVDVSDPGILQDVDTPDDLIQLG